MPGNDDGHWTWDDSDWDEIEFTLDDLAGGIEEVKDEWDQVLEDLDHKDNFDRARTVV